MRGFSRLMMIGVALGGVAFRSEVHASDGAFDATFGSGGRTTFNLSASLLDGGTTGVELHDGKLLIVGICNQQACLAKLKTDGSFDSSYGPLQLGYARFDQFPNLPAQSSVQDVIALSDDRVVLSGCYGSNSAALYVIRADGTGFDTSVGNGSGYISGTQGSAQFYDCAFRVRRQTDGKFVVLQTAKDSTYGTFMLVSRVKADLSGLDTAFGVNGIARIAFGLAGQTGNADLPEALLIQADGSIVVAGYSTSGDGHKIMDFARLTASGQLDPAFGGNGDGRYHYVSASTINTRSYDIALGANQQIWFGGSYDDGSTFTQTVGRLTTAGVLDASFHSGFITYGSVTGTTGFERIARIVVTADSILALGSIPRTNGSPDRYFEVTRLDLSGSMVSSFGAAGSSYASFADADTDDTPRVELVTARGIVVAGSTINGSALQFGVARLQFDHIFGSRFE